MERMNHFQEQVCAWPGVSIRPHRFGGTEFCYGNAEIGHIHPGGILDIPMPLAIHEALLEEGLAEQHRWVPNSGWITYRMRGERELKHALWLARLSYLRYALKKSDDPYSFFASEREALRLSPRFAQLLERFLPAPEQTIAGRSQTS